MDLTDGRGRPLEEVTLRLSEDEVTDLLVAASQLDGGEENALVQGVDGRAIVIYRETGEPTPLDRNTDWWVGPLILVAVMFLVVGAYTIARGILGLLF